MKNFLAALIFVGFSFGTHAEQCASLCSNGQLLQKYKHAFAIATINVFGSAGYACSANGVKVNLNTKPKSDCRQIPIVPDSQLAAELAVRVSEEAAQVLGSNCSPTLTNFNFGPGSGDPSVSQIISYNNQSLEKAYCK
jgi:hypothetical protein